MPPMNPFATASSGVVADPLIARLPPALRNRVKDFFVYTADFLPLAASLSQTTNIAIQSDSAFVVVAGVGVVTDVTNLAQITFVPELVQLKEAASGRDLLDFPTHYHNLFGTAELPAFWAFPKLLPPAGVFSVTLQNLEATARNVRLAFLGFKVFAQEYGPPTG